MRLKTDLCLLLLKRSEILIYGSNFLFTEIVQVLQLTHIRSWGCG